MIAEPGRPAYKKKRRRKVVPRDQWSITRWKEEAWKSFSKYIRTRDCLRTTGTIDKGVCITCGRVYPMRKMQAGHFMPGREDDILFDEQAVHGQCYRCNVVQSGQWPAYYMAMADMHGRDWIDDQLTLWSRKDKRKYTIPELKALERYYIMELKSLTEGRS